MAQDTFNLVMTPSRIFLLRGADKRGMPACLNEPLLFYTARCESLIWHARTLFIMDRNYCQEAWAELTALWMPECYRGKKMSLLQLHWNWKYIIFTSLYPVFFFFFLLFFRCADGLNDGNSRAGLDDIPISRGELCLADQLWVWPFTICKRNASLLYLI